MRHIQKYWRRFLRFLYAWCGKDYDCKCGHKAKKRTFIKFEDGVEGLFILNGLEYCPQCFKAAAIKCAWCGKIIVPGDPVTLYTPTGQDWKLPKGARIYKEKPRLQVVGCLRWDCADTGADRSGFWVMPGRVERVASPMEMAMASNDVVIVSDLSDMNKAIPIHDE